MGWDKSKKGDIQPFTEAEVNELEIYFSMMDPIEVLFSKLNGENHATLHLVYPSIQVSLYCKYLFNVQISNFQDILIRLEPIRSDERSPGHALAVELTKQIQEYFEFVLDEASSEFLVVYWVACYLAPVQKLMLSAHQVERVKQYIRG